MNITQGIHLCTDKHILASPLGSFS